MCANQLEDDNVDNKDKIEGMGTHRKQQYPCTPPQQPGLMPASKKERKKRKRGRSTRRGKPAPKSIVWEKRANWSFRATAAVAAAQEHCLLT